MKSNRHIVLEGKIKLLSPLSHIGESTGTESFCNTIRILGADGQPVEIFLYSGNAFRGALRDLGAEYLMDALSIETMPLDTFYLFFSGGSIGGKQSIDIDQARRLRAALPLFSIFGGGVGNQLIGGKMAVGALYPICRETAHILPRSIQNSQTSWRQFLTEQNYTRTDDAKNERLHQKYLVAPQDGLLPLEIGAKKPDDRKPQQMRYTMELIAPGAKFYQRIDFSDVSELELGAFVSAMHEFRKHPYIGGNSRIGHGLCQIDYTWRDAAGGDKQHFLSVGSDVYVESDEAKQALEAYNKHLKEMYINYLEDNKAGLGALVSGDAS